MADSDERLAEHLEILTPNPFERRDHEGHGASDAEMPTASPRPGPRDGRIAAAPALPQPPMYSGRTMQDRRDFMRKYEGYLVKVNALQTEWTAALAMPVNACIETDTRRMIARWEFSGASPETITEEQWEDYFRQALVPTFVDYASIDTAMKSLKMKTKWPEPESRMMHLQADMEAILNRFNVTDLAFKHEQRRLVGYLTKALEPMSFREVVATKLTLLEFKPQPKLLHVLVLAALAGGAAVESALPTLAGEAAEVVAVAIQAPGSPVVVVTPVAIPITGPEDAATADVEVVGVDAEAQGVVVLELEARLSDKEGRTAPHDLAAPASTVARRNIKSWAAQTTSPARPNACWRNCNTSLDFTLGRPIMTVLGYSADEQLVRARGTKSEWELGDKEQVGDDAETTALQRMCRMQTRARDIALYTMALEGLVNNTATTDQDWGGSNTAHGGTDSPRTIFKTKNLTSAYWQLPLSSSGAQVLAFQTLDGCPCFSRVPAGAHATATENADAMERHETRTALPSLRLHDSSAVHDMLDSKLAAARAKGLSGGQATAGDPAATPGQFSFGV
ncbi:hypothetical protein PF010_g2348 [Phytophthora fragariae]|uniref:Uncharacterized protein n=2 Tax=Phytophthora fragariae TaxID=53985 RepID=A0A6G0LXZ5_9STRA|nr:hypothetical protein PF010_g2348 [Phytophthora fragariae]